MGTSDERQVLATVEDQPIYWDGKTVSYNGYGRIDDDGTGGAHGDPYHQSDTSLHNDGHPLNADVDRYIVVPPQILDGVKPIVLGSKAVVTYQEKTADAVVGDVGPHHRLGEMSMALASALGINPNPNIGGVDSPVVHYEITPGVAAEGYKLQAS